ncbi:MAG: alpha/beta fold hydrolase [Cellulomonas sp.]|uniref:alpha/beta fold hydrolase n=1 Tax=Cellulomonas sp. TaxID=40001 RepID=UPI0019E4082F|nr:alpha/beta fold hydrolase [Cellulomonas sp.]MBF0688250.1 alpha/beta fold hydrolase [Cellulomonas sp.]
MSGTVRRRARAGAVVLVAVAVALLVAPPASAAPVPVRTPGGAAVPVTVWAPCDEPELAALALECAVVEVPRDRAWPRAGSERLAVARHRAQGDPQERAGVLVVHAGGPGIPGRSAAGMFALRAPAELLARYDVVGIDPRGVGGSTPTLGCDDDHLTPVRPDPVPADPRAEAALLLDAAGYTLDCVRAHGARLPSLGTADAVEDLEAVRRALGEVRLSVVGYGYGAYVAAVHATRHPSSSAHLVLDSSLRPDGDLYQHYLDQSRDFDARAQELFAWMAEHHGVYGMGTTAQEVATAYDRLRARTVAEPVDGVIGPWELESTFLNLAWETAFWPFLGQALSDADRGDVALLRFVHEQFGSHPHDNSYAAYTASQCADARWPRSWGRWRTDAQQVHRDAPFIGWNNVWYVAPCVTWPVPGRPAKVGTAVPALVVHATGDAGMRLSGGEAMHRAFPRSRMVVSDGGREHSVSLVRQDACVDAVVVDYLLHDALPAETGRSADVTCPAGPAPEPWPAAPAAPSARALVAPVPDGPDPWAHGRVRR